MTPLDKLADIARTNSLVLSIRRILQSTMTAAAGAFGVALIAAPCFAVAAPASGATTPASTNSAPATQPARSENAAIAGGGSAIQPFRVSIPQTALDDLRKRLLATRWPTKELVEDRSQGVQLATLRELARYWSTEYDWRKCEARLNALPQFTTEIDGVEIHFIHVRSRHENALPLIMTHGWPGSVIELLETVGPLTDPTKYGGTPGDAFHLVLPSLPGYGFSGDPARLGVRPHRPRVGEADGAPRLHALRRAGGRRGRLRHGLHGAPSARGPDRHSPQLARGGVGHRR
jgi:hypothetical protein